MKHKLAQLIRLRNIGLIIVDWLRRMPAERYLHWIALCRKAGISVIIIAAFAWHFIPFGGQVEGLKWGQVDIENPKRYKDYLRPRAAEERPQREIALEQPDFEITGIIRMLQNGSSEQKIAAATAVWIWTVRSWTPKSRLAIPDYEQARALVAALQSLVVTRDQEISYAIRSASEGAKKTLELLICADTSRYNMAIRDLFFPLAAPFVKVADLPSIWGERQQKVRSVDQLKIIVDPPLVKACCVLFEKGITTTFSSANGIDFMERGYGSIEIYSNSLSGKNLRIADDLEREGILEKGVKSIDQYWTIKFPFDANTSVWDLSERAARVVERFYSQREGDIRDGSVTELGHAPVASRSLLESI